jgi:hypothetical protein
MKKLLLGAFASVALLCFSAGAWADPVSEVWLCSLEEGKTLDDAQAANSKWLAWMRAKVNKEITSSAITAVVGKTQEFRWVDTYPDLATWAAAKAALDTEEGAAAEAVFEGITNCGSNQLYRVRATK